MRIIKLNLLLISLIMIIIIPLNLIINTSIKEVNFMNQYYIDKNYEDFNYVSSLDTQLKSNNYDDETTIALHYFASTNYDFGWAQKRIESLSDNDLKLNKKEINDALESIYSQIALKSNVLGYGIFFFKWLIIANVFEGLRNLLIKLYDKAFRSRKN